MKCGTIPLRFLVSLLDIFKKKTLIRYDFIWFSGLTNLYNYISNNVTRKKDKPEVKSKGGVKA